MLPVLSYHRAITSYFQQQPGVWDFFASRQHKEEQLQSFRTDLLKNTYQFDPAVETALYQKVSLAKEKLGLTLPVTIYQDQYNSEVNAAIVYVGGEAHIVFSGKLIAVLTEDELLAIIGHELSHVLLYTQLNGEVEVADRIVTAMANHPGSGAAQYETARLFKLYTELYCDRGAYLVTGHYAPVITALVKLATGLDSVQADSYIKQAEEIFAADQHTRSSGFTHPENFIRARATWAWHTSGNGADRLITEMIEGITGLDQLDLFGQERIQQITWLLVNSWLSVPWMKTVLVEAHTRQFLGNQAPELAVDLPALARRIQSLHPSLQHYLAYVLYDFTVADKQLEDLPMGLAFFLAANLHLEQAFQAAVKKERKLTDKKLAQLKTSSMNALEQRGNPLQFTHH
ncbi:MAG: M48 family metalloprotease [Candidatus Pseudobacter hemicellulosilyticus]|uniref:M48 family metalloprotease n=1 Tax=Candidatus Pseudobacter hemicellulosilyticus TaxID=3121375 RepID=A0AAJ5WRT9_9BACT|nr:MAG: M48 family metalloprotease [Pseudobacter sp.]